MTNSKSAVPSAVPPALPEGQHVVWVVGAAIFSEGRCLVARRNPEGTSGGLWEFPGGKVEEGETPEEALRREIQEELTADIEVGSWIGRGSFQPDERLIVLDVYLARPVHQGAISAGPDHQEIRWLKPDALLGLLWAKADIPIVPRVAETLMHLGRASSMVKPDE